MYSWIIGICSSEADGVSLRRFSGSKEEVKEKLASLVTSDIANDTENWNYGSETSKEIMDVSNGLGYEYYGYGVYNNYHIEYTAVEFSHVAY